VDDLTRTLPPAGVDALGVTSSEFISLCRAAGFPASTALEAYRRALRSGKPTSPVALSLAPITTTLREESPEGEVIKFLQSVPAEAGGARLPQDVQGRELQIESVLIPMIGGSGTRTYTLCISSQVGCAMGCTFCETAQMGLIRSLTPSEIVGQWYAARHVVGVAPKNIVFMGMGEPMDNYDNVIQAVAVLKDHNGAGVPISNITISTVGRVDGIRKLAEQIKNDGWHRLNLALSLNAPNDAVRSEIMPVNRKWRLEELQEALLAWPKFAGNKLCIEYVLIPGVNDRPEHVGEIAEFMRPFKVTGPDGLPTRKPRALINLIPYNPRRNSPWPAPREEDVDTFLSALIAAGVFAKRRRTKGRSMMGACGQLGAAHIRQRRLVEPTVSA
jgi:23S rRNA (adenine2503-C2)-methyltransferase